MKVSLTDHCFAVPSGADGEVEGVVGPVGGFEGGEEIGGEGEGFFEGALFGEKTSGGG